MAILLDQLIGYRITQLFGFVESLAGSILLFGAEEANPTQTVAGSKVGSQCQGLVDTLQSLGILLLANKDRSLFGQIHRAFGVDGHRLTDILQGTFQISLAELGLFAQVIERIVYPSAYYLII